MKAMYFHPLFDEYKCSYRFSFCLMDAFKQRGVMLERADYQGTGESGGLFENVTLNTIRQDMDSLISKNIDVLIGLRFGASVIFDYLRRNKSCNKSVILIEPIFSGSKYIDYLLRKQRLKDQLTRTPKDFYLEDEFVNLEGYKTRKTLIDQMHSFSFHEIDGNIPSGCRIEILFTRPKLLSDEAKAISELKKRNKVMTEHLQFPDIWERIPIVDYSPLIERVIGYCHEN